MSLFALRSPGLSLCAALAVASGFLSGPLAAQSTGAAETADTTLRDTLQLESLYSALRLANPMLAAAQAKADAAQSRAASAGVPPDPQLQIGWMNYALPALAPMPVTGMTQVQVMQMVPVAGQLGLARGIAGATAEAERARAEGAWWEVRTVAARRFHELYAVHGTLGVMRETLGLLDDIRRTAEAMYRSGEGRQTDVLRAQVEIARMVEDTLRMHAAAVALMAQINALLARAPDAPLGIPVLPARKPEAPSVAALMERAATQRPALRAALAESRAAEQMSRLARRELYPDLQIGVQYGTRTSTMPAPGGGGGVTSEREHMGSLMLGASVPIFARRRQLQERETATAMHAMARADEAAVRAETYGTLGVVRAELERARRLQGLYRSTILPQAEAAVSSAEAAYRSGSVDFMTLLDGRMSVNRFRQELIALEADEGLAWAELEMLVGAALTSAGATP